MFVVVCWLSLVVALCLSERITGQSVTVQLQLFSESGCIGGDVGLSDTSPLLQLRILLEGGPVEWSDVTALDIGSPDQIIMETLNLDVYSSVQGVQFRLIQLEHGGGNCNCWTLDSMSVTSNDQAAITLSYQNDSCFETGDAWIFCDGNAKDARGMVTRVFYTAGSNGTECANHGDILIASQGPSLPQDCTAVTPRL